MNEPNYGGLIREMRKEKGITIVQLAKEMGVGQGYIARVEKGIVKPTKEQLEVLAHFIEITYPPLPWWLQ